MVCQYKGYRYFTTPIYYANGSPHAGHVYTTLLAKTLKIHYTDRHYCVKLLTGLDEHGEAVAQKAQELGVLPQNLVDDMAQKWEESFKKLHIPYDIFMRTSSPEHKHNVQTILTYCYEKGDIYYGEHSGYYCIKCESFLNSSERDEQNICFIHKRKTELRKEANYFFAVSKYKTKLKELIESGAIVSQERFKNELLGLLESMEGDLSISRLKERLTWGIELPFDSNHVAYVWFDALPNYLTGLGGFHLLKNTQNEFWLHTYHLLGKDILKFHGIFWPAICLSLGLKPAQLFVHGWLLKDSHKMSKSLGNTITFEQVCHYGTDMFVNCLFRTEFGEDIDLSWKTLFERYNADLANGIGNLLSRTLTLCQKQFDSKIPQLYSDFVTEEQSFIFKTNQDVIQKVCESFDSLQLGRALDQMNLLLSLIDKYLSLHKPWTMNSVDHKEQLSNILYISIATLRTIGFCFHAFFPEKMNILLESLGEDTTQTSDFFERAKNIYHLRSGYTIDAVPRLFTRIDMKHEIIE